SLADQAANHRVHPEQIIGFNEDRLSALQAHRSEQPYASALQRIELARAVRRFPELKRSLRVIDFGDPITLALHVMETHPQVSKDYRERFHTAVLDEYQDTNVAQADLLAAAFGQ